MLFPTEDEGVRNVSSSVVIDIDIRYVWSTLPTSRSRVTNSAWVHVTCENPSIFMPGEMPSSPEEISVI